MLFRRFDMVWPIPSHLSFTPLHGFHSTLALGAAKKQSSRYVATPTDQTSTLAPGEKGSGWVEDTSMAAPTVASLTSRPIHTCRLWHEPSVSLGCLMTLSVFYLFHAPKLWNILEKYVEMLEIWDMYLGIPMWIRRVSCTPTPLDYPDNEPTHANHAIESRLMTPLSCQQRKSNECRHVRFFRTAFYWFSARYKIAR